MSRITTRVLRLKAIETLLIRSGSSGLKIVEIADKLKANRRTIYRDIDCLSSEFCLPIYENDDGRHCIHLDNYQSPFPGA